jgi:hypothetical protein
VITRRRCQEFHDLLEGGSTTPASSYTALLDVVGGLRMTPAPVADPAFVAALREQLITEAETLLAAAAAERLGVDERLRRTPTAPGVRRRNRRLAAAITGMVLVGGSATVAVAAQSALPGDSLYPLKRDIESAHAGLAFGRATRGEVLLHSASNRLDEAEALSRNDADPARVDVALDAFSSQARAGSDLLVQDYQSSGNESSMTTVRTFTASTMARLRDLEPVVPTASLPQLLHAAQALDQIESVAVQTCPACSGPLVTSIPTVLTGATGIATGAWTTVTDIGGHYGNRPRPGSPGPSPSGSALAGPGGSPPQGSVTEPPVVGPSSDIVTGSQVGHTIHDLTGGPTAGDSPGDLASDTASNAVGAVGQVGDTVSGTVGNTVGGLASAVPSDVASSLPSLP